MIQLQTRLKYSQRAKIKSCEKNDKLLLVIDCSVCCSGLNAVTLKALKDNAGFLNMGTIFSCFGVHISGTERKVF